MVPVLVVLAMGILLSAFFSGSETGFYRVTRTKLALDALSGDPIAKGLLWLTNNPALFVATTLVGNNLANYVTSWAIVWATGLIWAEHSSGLDLGVSIMMTPLIFVYGELMPKNLFFAAPNRLLRWAGPFFLCCTVVFLPLAAVLWFLGRLLEKALGESPERLQLRLMRGELRRVFSEGHEAGLLQSTQRTMTEGMFRLATIPLERFCEPMTQQAVARESMSNQEMLRIARRSSSPIVFVQDDQRNLCGYVLAMDLYLDQRPAWRPLLRISRRESSIAALTTMQENDQPHALVVADDQEVMGVVKVACLFDELAGQREM